MEEPNNIPPTEQKAEFKKPQILVGRIGKLPKKAKSEVEKPNDEKKDEQPVDNAKSNDAAKALPPAVLLKEMSCPIPYKEPKWSGLCPEGSDYALEVIKSGMIVDKVDLTSKAYFVFGRLANCDVVMAHPTISRHHCVIQYKAFASDGEPSAGWYMYDLGSTHGTFLNKDRLKSHHYTRVRVGHQIKFGNSTRTYIMLGPDFDCDGESELTVTEIKQKALEMKLNRDRMIQEAVQERDRARLEEEKRREEQGIDWGMGEDAEEETDLSENPFAATSNEELYLDDPKKTLRGYFEREGHELTYHCEERGVGQFLCRVELPLDDPRGRPLSAEVIHRGKKREAVVACAMEACRMLDRAGLLRQATHESRRRKQRDWSENDFYDSDDDTFLDRTGVVEKKREMRINKKTTRDEKPMTYDDLLNQITELQSNIKCEEKSLDRLRATAKTSEATSGEGDALDEYMNSLGKQSMSQKAEISKTKMRIHKLKAELSKVHRLAEIARPAHLPPLLKKDDRLPAIRQTNNAVFGKRLKLKEEVKKPQPKQQKTQDSEFVEEMDSDDEAPTNTEAASSTSKSKEKGTHDSIDHSRSQSLEEENKTTVPNSNKPETDEKDTVKDRSETKDKTARVFGPMRPPEDYVIPESYFEQESDRDMGVMEDD